MRLGLGLAFWFRAVFILIVGISGSLAAERNISLLPDMDLPGHDYAVIKNETAGACEAICREDRICRAFTFNQSANWCFLKSVAGETAPFANALSGRVEMDPTPEAIEAERRAELPFPGADLIEAAHGFAAALPESDAPPPGQTYGDLVAAGDEASAQQNPSLAVISYRQALAITPNDPALWRKLAESVLGQLERNNDGASYDMAITATHAALNAFLRSEEPQERAAALAALGQALEHREMWREALASYRASLNLTQDSEVAARLERVEAEHGFRMVSHQVDAEATTPRICAVFSGPLPTTGVDLSNYVVVSDAPQVAVEAEQSQVCLTGVEFGRRYRMTLRAGLPSADGEALRKDVDLEVYVPDRAPFVGFANNAYVMPAGLGGGLPISSVNARTADIEIYRIGDRSMASAIRNGIFMRTLDGYSAEEVANQYGELVWDGQVELAEASPNAMGTTAIPVGEAITDMQPGAYVITAKVADIEQEYWREVATQWFIVSDIGLTSVSGEDGVHAFLRSLDSAQPVIGAKVRLVAVNNEILGEATSDATGRADFAPGLARGEGGRAPQMLVAETDEGDYAFLDLSKGAFDLTDRGVEGRPAPGPLDLFATTERGVYRPGETVYLTALLRDNQAKAVSGLALTLEVERPDGVVATREVLRDQGAGGYFAPLPMVSEAMRGSWHLKLYADPKADPLANIAFLVEDFEPERLAFEVAAPDTPVELGAVAEIDVDARYLYGATAPDLGIEADTVIRPVTTLEGFPGYVFGRVDDTFETFREPLGKVGTTDEHGHAVAEVTLPEVQSTTRPLEAQILLRLLDTNGRSVERSLTRPVRANVDRIGVRPQFSGELGQGEAAKFDVIAVSPEGQRVAKQDLRWRLSRIETRYQWYRANDAWRWEAVSSSHEVANGTIDALAGGPVAVSAPVDWGQYQLEVESGAPGATSTSYQFYAGYFYPEAGSDTPDTLSVALDKTGYRIGDTANLRLDPQFAGTALVMVVDDSIIDMQAVEVPEEGLSVPLTITEDWGPGAYVTAVLYRPASAAEKRMPSRALGLAFASVEPGDMRLDLRLDAPQEALPRQPLTMKVAVDNAKPGEKAYVAVAAVDLGILNLTNFKTPDPDGWYFGQRQLGMEVRDLYGQLIDPLQGLPGALRSGGDASAARLGTPPPTSVLVAQHSGIVEVGPDGTAEVSFDMPDFNGTVRLMAIAWSESAVGHAESDVVVRDPVVVNLSPPRFLRLHDRSRLLVEINNVAGPAGEYRVALVTEGGLRTGNAQRTVELAAGARTSLDLDLTGTSIGDKQLTLTVADPAGQDLVKELTLGVRGSSAPQTTSRLVSIAPGDSLVLDADEFDGLLPNTGSLTLALGPIARLDLPSLMLQLDRYPYGCAEQVSSRAMPLLYLNEVAQAIGLGTDEELEQKVRDAITDLLSKQSSTGGFGLWGPFSITEMWLDAYVTDFLLRAKAQGFEVPEQALIMALDNLANQVSYSGEFTEGGEDVAYALYDLARAGRATIGDLRYYVEARLKDFRTPLAKAQLGAALALYGDTTRAANAFASAMSGLRSPDNPNRYRPDYGSQLRDTAAVLALVAEFKPAGVDVSELAGQLAALRDSKRYTSTQEDAWTLVAGAALVRETGGGSVTIDGIALEGTVHQRYDQEEFAASPVTILNNGTEPVEAKVSVTGVPAEPPEAGGVGFAITREYYLPDGTSFDPQLSLVRQNDRFVVQLTVTTDRLGSGQYVIADPLPAGFEIENPNLGTGASVADMSWLTVDMPAHVEARTDQFVAAFRYVAQTERFSAAYIVRAVSPGSFVLPGATVEDMYRPELRANTDAGSIEVAPAGG